MPSPSHDVELALYADDTAIIATSSKPKLLVSQQELYLNDLQRCLSERRIAIIPLNAKLNSICYLLALLGAHHVLHVSRIGVNVSKSTEIIFASAGRRFI